MENPTRLSILHGDRDDGPGGSRTAKLQDRKLKTIAFHREARSTRLVILIKNIYTLWGRKRFLLPVTYFPTNLVYNLIKLFNLKLTSLHPKSKPHNYLKKKW